MNPRVFVALLTVVVFAAGYLARLLTEPAPSVPPAPAALTREFAPPAGGGERRQRQLADAQRALHRELADALDRVAAADDQPRLRATEQLVAGERDHVDAALDRVGEQRLAAEQRRERPRAGELEQPGAEVERRRHVLLATQRRDLRGRRPTAVLFRQFQYVQKMIPLLIQLDLSLT